MAYFFGYRPGRQKKIIGAGSHVMEGLEKIQSKTWDEPLGKELIALADVVSLMNEFVPGVAMLGGALAMGASALNPQPTAVGELNSDSFEIKMEMKSILKNIREQNLTGSDEVLTMMDLVAQTYPLVGDIRYRVGCLNH